MRGLPHDPAAAAPVAPAFVFSPNEVLARTPASVVWVDNNTSTGRIIERLMGMPAIMTAANDRRRRIGGRNRQDAGPKRGSEKHFSQ